MIAIDFRNITWESLQEQLTGRRLQVLAAWRLHGPATTRELSERSGIDILTLRPRTTELLDLGFLMLVSVDERRPVRQHEGVYRARSTEEATRWLEWKRSQPLQPDLPLQIPDSSHRSLNRKD